MSNLSNYTPLEILELANLCCPAFSLLNHRIGSAVQPTDVVKDRLYCFVSIREGADFPTVDVELVEVLECSEQQFKGLSQLPSTKGKMVEITLDHSWVFSVESQPPYVPRDSLLRTVEFLLGASYFENTMPKYMASHFGLVDGNGQIDWSHKRWEYGRNHSFQRCTILDVAKGDCVVVAGEYAEYGEYGRDNCPRIRQSSGGEIGQCMGFAYVDIPLKASTWTEFQAWSTQKTELNLFSTEHQSEATIHITERNRWIQEEVCAVRSEGIEPMYERLSDVPNTVLNPQLSVKIQRIWVMIFRTLCGSIDIQPICLQSGQLNSMGGRLALFKVLREPVAFLKCPRCQQFSPQLTEGSVCPSCIAWTEMIEALPIEWRSWADGLSEHDRIEVEEVQSGTTRRWEVHLGGIDSLNTLLNITQWSKDCVIQSVDENRDVVHWCDGSRNVEVTVYYREQETLGNDEPESNGKMPNLAVSKVVVRLLSSIPSSIPGSAIVEGCSTDLLDFL